METTRYLKDDSDGDIESDTADENENNDDNGSDGDTDEDAEGHHVKGIRDETMSSERGSYLCPDKKCKGRKADKTLKKYIRHYDIRNRPLNPLICGYLTNFIKMFHVKYLVLFAPRSLLVSLL